MVLTLTVRPHRNGMVDTVQIKGDEFRPDRPTDRGTRVEHLK